MRRRVWGRGLVAAMMAATALGACRQVLGIDAYHDAPADAGVDTGLDASACGLSYGSASCAACVATSCCAESTACAGNLGCAKTEQCLGACAGDPACRASCFATSFALDLSPAPLAACLASSCAQACNLSCGGMAANVSPASQAAACQACLQNSACTQESACATSSDCQAYAQCLHSCFTPDCREACATNDAGATLFAALDDIATGTGACATPCGYGQDWSCLGQVTWPMPMATTTNILFAEVNGVMSLDIGQGTPIADAQVSVCGSVSAAATCDSPFASGQTSIRGSVTVSVPTATASAEPMGLELSVLFSAPGYSPTYCDLTFPLSQAALTFPPAVSVLFAQAPSSPLPADIDGSGVDAETTEAGALDDAGPAPTYTVIAAILDCQGHPAAGVKLKAVTPQGSLCSLGPDVPGCPEGGPPDPASRALSFGGLQFFTAPAGTWEVTAYLPQDALPCCSGSGLFALLGLTPDGAPGPSPMPLPLPPQDAGAVVLLFDAGARPQPMFTDAGILCTPQPDGGCAPQCSMDPGCVPAGGVPPALDGGLIGTFSVNVPDASATTIVWIEPQPR